MKRKDFILVLGFIFAIVCLYTMVYADVEDRKREELVKCVAATDGTDSDCYECELKVYGTAINR